MNEFWKREAPSFLQKPEGPLGLPDIHLVTSMFWYAIEDRASAIHIEPKQKGILIQFCIHGVLQDKCEIDRETSTCLIHRLRMMLSTDDALCIIINDIEYSLRLSAAMTCLGESVTMTITPTGNVYRDAAFTDLSE